MVGHRRPLPVVDGARREVLIGADESRVAGRFARKCTPSLPRSCRRPGIARFSPSRALRWGLTVVAVQESSEAPEITHFTSSLACRISAICLLPFDEILDPVWERARGDGGFGHYATVLEVVLDALDVWPSSASQPGIFAYLRSRLSDVGSYITPGVSGESFGDSWDATRLWRARKGGLKPVTRKELRDYAKRIFDYGLSRMLLD